MKPEPAASVQSYDNWELGYQNLDQQGGGYELVGSGGESNSQYWFQGNTPRHEQEYDARATGGEGKETPLFALCALYIVATEKLHFVGDPC